MQRFDEKNPSESIVLTFDLSAGLATGETLTGTPTVTIALLSGTDPTPSAVLAGGNQLDSSKTLALVPVTGGVDSCDYEIKVVCSTTNALKILALPAILPVRN